MIFGTGNPHATIMLVGECFTREEESAGEAFLGRCGEDLNKMLFEAGINRNECYVTNLVNNRPPNDDISNYVAFRKNAITPSHIPFRNLYCTHPVHHGYRRLAKEIDLVKPRIIIAFGNMAMWALTGASGIVKWRGSQLPEINLEGVSSGIIVIPTLPPYMVTYIHENRAMVVSDLRRAKKLADKKTPYQTPGHNWNFTIRPSFAKAFGILKSLTKRLDDGIPLWIDFDLETRAGHIACAGISWTKTDALCIPLMCVGNYNGYWTVEEESELIYALYKLLTHKSIKVRGQNLLYDCQYTYRHWHYVPRVVQDTMISHHTCFCGLPKKLDFQASLYCENYVQWKPEKTSWKSGG